MNSYTYTAYGLNFASSFPLPYLTWSTSGTADITISYGKVPETLPLPSGNGAAWQAAPGKLLLSVSEVARYLILENREIVIEPLPGISENDVSIFLLGSVLGALLHAREMLVLHASVIQTERGAVLFMGCSGAGKSTLLGAFLRRGYAMAADDKAGIVVNEDGVAHSLPAFPFTRLMEDTVNELKFPVGGLSLNRALGKYMVPVERFCAQPLAIRAAYSLNVHNQGDISLEPLHSLERFQVLNRHTYRRRFLHRAEQRQSHFQILGKLSEQARVVRVLRPDNPRLIEELVSRIEEDFAQ
jgi:hypothetical protein